MDIFERKGIKPMLLTEEYSPTESSDYICELKLDGIRCLAYLSDQTDLRNKRDVPLIATFPELAALHTQTHSKCILDGELIITAHDGSPDFEAMQARVMLTDPARICLASRRQSATFVAFDILYAKGEDVMKYPLMKRKELLADIFTESDRLAQSRIFNNASALFDLTTHQRLEGIVQKRKNSLYHPGKRSRDWIKVKNLIDEDFVACGYIPKGGQWSIVLGKYDSKRLIYQGHVTLGVSKQEAKEYPVTDICPFTDEMENHEYACWYSPLRVCTVRYMERTGSGSLRQPRMKGFRTDKAPQDCLL